MADSISSSPAFDIEVLPQEWQDHSTLLETSTRYRDFRLQALRLAPGAYASTYEQEVEFPPDVWKHRLQNTDAKHIMATAKTSTVGQGATTVDKGDWIGMIVVIKKQAVEEPSASRPPWSYNQSTPTNTDTKKSQEIAHASWYLFNGLFVHPSWRRTGLGKELVQAALSYVKDTERHGASSVKVNILVDTWNKGAVGLYSRCGFVTIREDEYQVGNSERKALLMSQTLDLNHNK